MHVIIHLTLLAALHQSNFQLFRGAGTPYALTKKMPWSNMSSFCLARLQLTRTTVFYSTKVTTILWLWNCIRDMFDSYTMHPVIHPPLCTGAFSLALYLTIHFRLCRSLADVGRVIRKELPNGFAYEMCESACHLTRMKLYFPYPIGCEPRTSHD